jgi:hypothetical protein
MIKQNIAESILCLKKYGDKSYWNRANTIEFICFMNKIIIIVPGLLFGLQWWWLYVFALISSLGLIWSGTVKLLPTIVLFNYMWSVLAIIAITKHFVGVT